MMDYFNIFHVISETISDILSYGNGIFALALFIYILYDAEKDWKERKYQMFKEFNKRLDGESKK